MKIILNVDYDEIYSKNQLNWIERANYSLVETQTMVFLTKLNITLLKQECYLSFMQIVMKYIRKINYKEIYIRKINYGETRFSVKIFIWLYEDYGIS